MIANPRINTALVVLIRAAKKGSCRYEQSAEARNAKRLIANEVSIECLPVVDLFAGADIDILLSN